MTQLVNIDFSGTLTTDFDKGAGTYASYSGGRLVFSGEGMLLAKTSLGTGNKWMRFQAPTWTDDDQSVGPAIATSAGTGAVIVLNRANATGNLSFFLCSQYTTYTTWANQDEFLSSTASAWTPATQTIGVTFEPSTNIVRIWPNVTAAAPTGINSWDGGAAPISETTSFDFGSTHDRLGFGSVTGAPPTHSFDNFTAGDFSAGGGTTTTKTLTDTLTITDQEIDYLRIVRVLQDSITVIDAVVQNIVRGGATIVTKVMTETLSITDGLFDWLRRVRQQGDTTVFTDGDFQRSFVLNAADTIDLNDGFVEWRRLKRVAQDNLDLIDSFSKTLVGQNIVYAKVMSDAITVIDDNGRRWALRSSRLSDAIGLSDAVIEALTRIRQLGEAIEFTDGVVRIGRLVRIAQDQLDIPDEMIRLLALNQLYGVNFKFGHTDPMRFGGM